MFRIKGFRFKPMQPEYSLVYWTGNIAKRKNSKWSQWLPVDSILTAGKWQTIYSYVLSTYSFHLQHPKILTKISTQNFSCLLRLPERSSNLTMSKAADVCHCQMLDPIIGHFNFHVGMFYVFWNTIKRNFITGFDTSIVIVFAARLEVSLNTIL